MEDVDREISEMKLSLNARARIVAESYLSAVSRILSFESFFSQGHLLVWLKSMCPFERVTK